ncbi:bifunctional 5,10-methylenetetrahydrofolate dehydrogenase/5,10-methenyltetrahydrofolate cyclohydrolase [Candidatus Saccharibacteria bacterium]|nr:bifunctional 5,10-methylenetetrahydrofolate dehydrogenase/5,10-methenyltetrahydrofolate cyclohydrolase [Candidatus Saccharibacteria bacterium]
MTKSLDGRELAGFIKERQAHQISSLTTKPHLLIIRDSDNPVITKYVNLKIQYGEDIGAIVEDYLAKSTDDIARKIHSANSDPSIHGIILQLPILDTSKTQELTSLIAPAKDVDGLSGHGDYDSATATAILWLLSGYSIDLTHHKIAIVGRGKLVGAPLFQIFTQSGYDVELFHRGDDLTKLKNFDIIISATGAPGLISDSMIKPGAILIDAGTASENGVLKGDISPEIRLRSDLAAITPVVGGVGPLTIACLFDHLLRATYFAVGG